VTTGSAAMIAAAALRINELVFIGFLLVVQKTLVGSSARSAARTAVDGDRAHNEDLAAGR
jgi:hypothetical protein